MKTESDTEETKTAEETKEKRAKKKLQVSESPGKAKVKKSGSIIKRFKLKGKNSSATSGGPDSEQSDEPQPSTSSEVEREPEPEPVERQTPEGGDSQPLEKAVSETNLTETSWKSAENLTSSKDDNPKSTSVINVQTSQYQLAVSDLDKASFLPQRTKSLENLKSMPAFGDLILDPAAAMSNTNQSGIKPKDHLYKILVIGDLGAGKTSIIKRYVHSFFSQHYRATIGVDFALKVINWDPNTLVRLQLWDIAGQERYGNMTRVYYKEAVGAFIVFDVTRVNTFESVANWKSDLDTKVQLPDGSPIPCVLLANKCDQPKEGIVNNPAKMDEYCKEKGFVKWFETSAKENINIEEATRALVTQILQNDSLLQNDANKDKDQFTLGDNSDQAKNKKCAC